MSKIIYHVDDDADIREAVQAILEGEGYKVTGFSSGEELLSNFSTTEKPDVVILDVIMEETDTGLKTFTALQKDNPQLKMIMLTSLGEMVRNYFEQYSEYITIIEKPIEPALLVSTVKNLLA